MKAAVVTGPGQAPLYADFPEPQPAEGEVRLTVTAAALSHVTRSRASGHHYSSSGDFPFIPGVDGVGRLNDGGRVCFVLPRAPYGAMAERTVVAARHCVPVPDGLDDVTAAAIANPGVSSWAALTERAGLKPGETVLVNGATGTAGRLAVKIARHLGAGRIVATGRNAATLASLGVDATLDLSLDPAMLQRRLMEVFADGVDIVLDYLWGPSAEALLAAGARAGADTVPIRFVQIGAVSGPDITLPSAALRASAIQLTGSGLGSIPFAAFLKALGDMLGAAVAGGLTTATTPVPLSEVASAWMRDDDTGRIVFVPETPDILHAPLIRRT